MIAIFLENSISAVICATCNVFLCFLALWAFCLFVFWSCYELSCLVYHTHPGPLLKKAPLNTFHPVYCILEFFKSTEAAEDTENWAVAMNFEKCNHILCFMATLCYMDNDYLSDTLHLFHWTLRFPQGALQSVREGSETLFATVSLVILPLGGSKANISTHGLKVQYNMWLSTINTLLITAKWTNQGCVMRFTGNERC